MLIVSICFAVLFAAANAVADPPRYRVIVVDLPGDVPEPQFVNPRMGINNRGELVSTMHDGSSDTRPIVWLPSARYGRPAGSSALPLAATGDFNVAVDLNVNGFAVGKATDVDPELYVDSSMYWDLNTNTMGIIVVSTDLSNIRKEQAFAINDADPPVVIGQTWAEDPNDPQNQVNYGYRKVLGGSHVLLDFYLSGHTYAWPYAIADSGFVAGTSRSNYPASCTEQQDVFRAVTWSAGGSGLIASNNLVTLGTAQAETWTEPQGVNNASPSMIAGYGRDPNDPLPSGDCRERALFWSGPSASPTILPYLTINGQPAADGMRASSINTPDSTGVIRVVGRSQLFDLAVLWRRVNNVWEALNLKSLCSCGGNQWFKLSNAIDITSCGWIAGIGYLNEQNPRPRAFVAIPYDACPGDICGDVDYPNGKVDIDDLLKIVSQWGSSNCIFDITGDGTINIDDLLAVINNWGPCDCWPVQESMQSFSQTLSGAGLTMSDWNAFTTVMATGTSSEKENYNCWMERYLTGCVRCPSCPGADPFQ